MSITKQYTLKANHLFFRYHEYEQFYYFTTTQNQKMSDFIQNIRQNDDLLNYRQEQQAPLLKKYTSTGFNSSNYDIYHHHHQVFIESEDQLHQENQQPQNSGDIIRDQAQANSENQQIHRCKFESSIDKQTQPQVNHFDNYKMKNTYNLRQRAPKNIQFRSAKAKLNSYYPPKVLRVKKRQINLDEKTPKLEKKKKSGLRFKNFYPCVGRMLRYYFQHNRAYYMANQVSKIKSQNMVEFFKSTDKKKKSILKQILKYKKTTTSILTIRQIFNNPIIKPIAAQLLLNNYFIRALSTTRIDRINRLDFIEGIAILKKRFIRDNPVRGYK